MERWKFQVSKSRENERMMRNEDINDESHAIVVDDSERGRSQSRKQGGPRGRSKSQSRPQRDMSNVECYYCGENCHVQARCA